MDRVPLRVGYHLGGGPVSVYSSSCIIKAGPVFLLLGGLMDGPRVAVFTLGGVTGIFHGTTLVGASGRGSLGCIVGFIGIMASQKSLLVVTGPPVCSCVKSK